MLRNREDAGERLGGYLGHYKDDPTGLILALPRGGVAVGYGISLVLHLPLDVFITRKLGAPGNPEYAMGALAETGTRFLNEEAIRALGVSGDHVEREVRAQQEEIVKRRALYRRNAALPQLAGRTILLVDDGIATGSTFLASIEAIRGFRPKHLVGAIPVGPGDTLKQVKRQVDELIVLEIPEPFFAVSNHYVDFQQVDDQEVIRHLALAEAALEASQWAARA